MRRSFAQLIREGAALRPQSKAGLFVGGGSCAVGAAMEAAGYAVGTLEAANRVTDFQLYQTKAAHPVSGSLMSVGTAVWQLNDQYDWTREQIADWLEESGSDFEIEVLQIPMESFIEWAGVEKVEVK